LAASAGAEGLVCPLLDVRRREVAGALYRVDGRLTPVLDEAAGPLERILRRLPGGAVTVTGDALARYREEVLQMRPDAILAPRSRWSPTAGALGALAWERLRQGERDDRYQLHPAYVRTPVDEG
jgi:tRNA A37 threonylcarbamoyladenosine modification protein TsaB